MIVELDEYLTICEEIDQSSEITDLGDNIDHIFDESPTKPKLKRPPLYKVILHNDDYTGMGFVCSALQTFFNKSEQEAQQITLEIHNTGATDVGIYTKDVAETKISLVESAATEEEFPLRVTIEEN